MESGMDLNVSDVLEEANNIYNEITTTSEDNSNIDHALDMAEEVGASLEGVKQESVDSTTLRLVKLNMESILGFDLIQELKAGIKMEDGANTTQTKMIQESIQGIIRDFWQALKNSFNAIWARLKTWYITVTSASESLIKKANKIKDKAERIATSPTERKFEFKNYKAIHVGGKVSSPLLRTSLKDLKALVEQALNVRSTNEVENFISGAENALEDFVKSSNTNNADASWVKRFSDLYTPSVGVKTDQVIEPFIKEQIIFDEQNAEYKQSSTLPGNKVIVYSSLKETSTVPMHEGLGLISARVVNKDKREYNEQVVSAETLHPAQVADICDTIIDLNEQISFYEKAWQRRDKFMSKVLKELDKSIERIDQEDLQEGKDKEYKKTTRAILAAIKRSNTYNASLLNLVLAVSAGSLSYCDASLAMYKQA